MEVEKAYETYLEAINFHKSGKILDSYTAFKELFKSDLIVGHFYDEVDLLSGVQTGHLTAPNGQDTLSQISQKVRHLRFLAFRNRGFLYFDVLRRGTDQVAQIAQRENEVENLEKPLTSQALSKELFYTMMDDFVICTIYEEADELLLRALHDIYAYFGNQRLRRFTIEYAELFGNETDDALSVLPVNSWVKPFENQLKDELLGNLLAPKGLESKLAYLKTLREDYEIQKKSICEPQNLEVILPPGSLWVDVFQRLQQAQRRILDKSKLQEYQKHGFKFVDIYVTAETLIDSVVFRYDELSADDIIELSPSISAQIPDEGDTMEVDDDLEAENSDNLSQQVTPTPTVAPENEAAKSTDSAIVVEDEETAKENVEKPAETSEKQNITERVNRTSRRLNPEEPFMYDLEIVDLTIHHFVETEAFFRHYNQAFAEIFTTDKVLLHDVVLNFVTPEKSDSPLFIRDFIDLLNQWKSGTHSTYLLRDRASNTDVVSDKEDDNSKLLEVLSRFGNQPSEDADTACELLDDIETATYVSDFLALMEKSHYTFTRVELLRHFLGGDQSLLTTKKWSPSLYILVKDLVLQLDDTLFQIFDDPHLVVSVYEILVDEYILVHSELKTRVEKYPSSVQLKASRTFLTSSFELLRIAERVHAWGKKLKQSSDIPSQVVIRHLWAQTFFLSIRSITWKDSQTVVLLLQELNHLLLQFDEANFEAQNPNFLNIAGFSARKLHRRLTTASLLSVFTKILLSESKSASQADTITLLERILVPPEDLDHGTSETPNGATTATKNGLATIEDLFLLDVQSFLSACPIELKLNLWKILFSYYVENGDYEKFQRGFEENLAFILGFFNSESYTEQRDDSGAILLMILNFYGEYLRIFLKYLSSHKWVIPSDNRDSALETVINLGKMYEFLYCFSLHEEAALITSARISLSLKNAEAYTRLKDFFVENTCLLLTYLVNVLQKSDRPDKSREIANVLYLVHQHLGSRRLCDASNGLILKFLGDILMSNESVSELEVAQILSCRFHYKIKVDGRFPVDHYTVANSNLDQRTADDLCRFISPFALQNNPLIKSPRNDLRQVIDDIYDVVKDAAFEKDRGLAESLLWLENFLDHTVLNARLFKEAFHGLLEIKVEKPLIKNVSGESGLYFMEAVMMLSLYKIKKKASQSRTVELMKVMQLAKSDLLYGSRRVESWIILAQSYGLLVEDDLLWTSDKLNSIDRKVVTANVQKKSLMCYLMAVNYLTIRTAEGFKPPKDLVSLLFNLMTKELYSACRAPMAMIAFQAFPTSKLVMKNSLTSFQPIHDKPLVSSKFLLNLMYTCVELAIKANPIEWSSHFLACKIKDKLDMKPLSALDSAITASRLGKVQGSSADPILEATYKLCALTYKYVRSEKISVSEALAYIAKDPQLNLGEQIAPLTNTDADKEAFYKVLIEALLKIQALDKKGWYHKPVYKMASIHLNDLEQHGIARELMSKFFSLKSSSRTFLQLWKPEHERPGKHFVYMYQYTQLFIKLLRLNSDLSSLISLLPKVRKANSTMVSLYFAWERICSATCNLIRRTCLIADGFVERFLCMNSYALFMYSAKAAVEKTKTAGLTKDVEPFLLYLVVLNEARKLNNGFGPTSLIDDTTCAVFLIIYGMGLRKCETADFPAKPEAERTGRIKKIARKDLLPFIQELTTRFKRDAEQLMKDNPSILSNYVKKSMERRQREMQQEEQAGSSQDPGAAPGRTHMNLAHHIQSIAAPLIQRTAIGASIAPPTPFTPSATATTSSDPPPLVLGLDTINGSGPEQYNGDHVSEMTMPAIPSEEIEMSLPTTVVSAAPAVSSNMVEPQLRGVELRPSLPEGPSAAVTDQFHENPSTSVPLMLGQRIEEPAHSEVAPEPAQNKREIATNAILNEAISFAEEISAETDVEPKIGALQDISSNPPMHEEAEKLSKSKNQQTEIVEEAQPIVALSSCIPRSTAIVENATANSSAATPEIADTLQTEKVADKSLVHEVILIDSADESVNESKRKLEPEIPGPRRSKRTRRPPTR